MEGSHAIELILEYRYWILLPLSFVEGPIVAFFAGMLAAGGYFNVWALAVFFFFRDIVVDLLMYAIGYFGSDAPWVHRLLRRFGVTDEHLKEVRALWHAHPGKTMFLSKLSYGVAAGFIVVAGLVRMPLKAFLKYGSIVAVLHYGVLLVVGYFFGATVGTTFVTILERIPYVILGLSTLAVAYYLFKRSVSKRLEKAEKEIEEQLHQDSR